MILLQLLRHRWLQSTRGQFWDSQALLLVFMLLGLGFAVLMFGTMAVVFGQLTAQSTYTAYHIFSRTIAVLLILLPIEWVARFFFTSPLDKNLQGYFHLPIRRNTLTQLVLTRVFVSGWWVLPTVWLAIYFGSAKLLEYYGGAFLIGSIAALLIGNGLWVTTFKMWLGRRAAWASLVIAAGTIGGLVWLIGSEGSRDLRDFIYDYVPTWAFLIISLAYMFAGWLAAREQASQLRYPNQIAAIVPESDTKASALDFAFLRNLGIPGELIALELKLIFRNKRTRTAFLFSVFFVFYGLYITLRPGLEGDGNGQPVFLSMFHYFFMAMLVFNYGQFIPSWESRFFDGFLTRPTSYRQWLLGKYYMLAGFAMLLCFISVAVFAYVRPELIPSTLAAGLFNAGCGGFFILCFGAYNHKRLDLKNSSVFNWQGTSATQFLVMLPTVAFAFFAGGLNIIFHNDYLGSYLGAGLGLLTIATLPLWMPRLVALYQEKKYIQAARFRSTE